ASRFNFELRTVRRRGESERMEDFRHRQQLRGEEERVHRIVASDVRSHSLVCLLGRGAADLQYASADKVCVTRFGSADIETVLEEIHCNRQRMKPDRSISGRIYVRVS